jgi:hypothetical protein
MCTHSYPYIHPDFRSTFLCTFGVDFGTETTDQDLSFEYPRAPGIIDHEQQVLLINGCAQQLHTRKTFPLKNQQKIWR